MNENLLQKALRKARQDSMVRQTYIGYGFFAVLGLLFCLVHLFGTPLECGLGTCGIIAILAFMLVLLRVTAEP